MLDANVIQLVEVKVGKYIYMNNHSDKKINLAIDRWENCYF